MQSIVVTGNLGQDAELRSTQGGTDVCSFSVASKQGYGDKERTNWFRCSLWGKRAASLSPYLLKGVQVTVSGEFETDEYNGKPQLNIRVNDVALQGGRRGESKKPYYPDEGGGAAEKSFDDLDDNVPFLTNSPHLDRRVS